LYWCLSWQAGVPLLVPDPWYGIFPLICVVLYLLSWSNNLFQNPSLPLSSYIIYYTPVNTTLCSVSGADV
jgi:hypothetical protein